MVIRGDVEVLGFAYVPLNAVIETEDDPGVKKPCVILRVQPPEGELGLATNYVFAAEDWLTFQRIVAAHELEAASTIAIAGAQALKTLGDPPIGDLIRRARNGGHQG